MSVPIVTELSDAIVAGDLGRSKELVQRALAEGVPAETLLADGVKVAADVVGEKYEEGEYYLAELVRSGDCFKAVVTEIQDRMTSGAGSSADGRVVIATVEGDVHDIGKNLVATFLRGGGFTVDDLGVDVPATEVVDRALDAGADIIALSCLMSVTRDGVRRVCEELEDRGLRGRFVVLAGGAATNQRWADAVGCDGWAPSATEAAELARSVLAARKGA